jgi:hypothetical protein
MIFQGFGTGGAGVSEADIAAKRDKTLAILNKIATDGNAGRTIDAADLKAAADTARSAAPFTAGPDWFPVFDMMQRLADIYGLTFVDVMFLDNKMVSIVAKVGQVSKAPTEMGPDPVSVRPVNPLVDFPRPGGQQVVGAEENSVTSRSGGGGLPILPIVAGVGGLALLLLLKRR